MLNQNLLHLVNQRTISDALVFVGIGLHSGCRATMRLHPAEAGHGIQIMRRDLPEEEQMFNVGWQAVSDTTLCTTLGNPWGHEVATVEHLLSALAALGIDNLLIELDGPEVPVLDGSAMPYVDALETAGVLELAVRREVIVVKRPVRLQQGASWAELLPSPTQRITVSIDFNEQAIGKQSLSFELNPSIYRQEIAPARTFGFAEQLMQLRRRGLALGGSIKNAILVRQGRVENIEGLRFPDEFVRHKVLDVVGDLSLVGAPIIGHYRGNRPGHRLNTELLRLLMQDQQAWERVPLADADLELLALDGCRAFPNQQRDNGRLAHQQSPTNPYAAPLRKRLFGILGDRKRG